MTYAYQLADAWKFSGPNGEEVEVRVEGCVRANNGEALMHIALGHAGIVLLPSFIAGPYLRSGELEAVLTDWTHRLRGIYAVYPQNRHLSPKVRTFVDFLVSRFQHRPIWHPQPSTDR
ncbi:MAG: hypothetical protein KC561_01740 [Myxococcales bacterium]|nr:hypothetical protein [Myxococcales bacterium]